MKTIREVLSLLALALALTACGGGASSAVGKWNISLDETVAAAQKKFDAQVATMPAEQQAMMKNMLQPMLDAMKKMKAVMEIRADGTFTVDSTSPDGEASKVAGTWKLEGDQITMTGKEEGKDKSETIVGTLAGDTIRCEVGEGDEKATLVFHRG